MKNSHCKTIGLALAAAGGMTALATAGDPMLDKEIVANGLARPVQVTHAPGDTDRIFIVDARSGATGSVRIVDINTDTLLPTPFLTQTVNTSSEQGLLGLAFHPNYADNGYVYINYTRSGNTYIDRFTVSAGDPNVVDPGSSTPVMVISQPFSNHNGGWLGFGPDGYLYIATGDGGSGNDPGNRAQDITNQLLGKMLRIDVDGDDFPSDTNRNYAIPASNPFVGVTGDDEIWAYGLRNPWRCSFDRATGDLYIGDVGQNAREEISFQPAGSTGGENYGWRCMEGAGCTGLSGCTCNDPGLTDPIYSYNQGSAGRSVTGGHVYRGSAMPWLDGTYFFGDYISNRIWSFRYTGSVTEFQERTDAGPVSNISGFGEDANGELYLVSLNGVIYRLIAGSLPCNEDLTGNGTVGFDDVLIVLSSWGPCTASCDADLDNNGDVGFSDVLQILTAWGACPE